LSVRLTRGKVIYGILYARHLRRWNDTIWPAGQPRSHRHNHTKGRLCAGLWAGRARPTMAEPRKEIIAPKAPSRSAMQRWIWPLAVVLLVAVGGWSSPGRAGQGRIAGAVGLCPIATTRPPMRKAGPTARRQLRSSRRDAGQSPEAASPARQAGQRDSFQCPASKLSSPGERWRGCGPRCWKVAIRIASPNISTSDFMVGLLFVALSSSGWPRPSNEFTVDVG